MKKRIKNIVINYSVFEIDELNEILPIIKRNYSVLDAFLNGKDLVLKDFDNTFSKAYNSFYESKENKNYLNSELHPLE